MTWQLIMQFGTLCIAAWGAILSTYVYRRQRLDRKPIIQVTKAFGVQAIPGIGISDQMLILTASNLGERSVHLQSSVLELPDRRSLVCFSTPGNTRFPHELVPGTSCNSFFPLSEVEKTLRQYGFANVPVVGLFRDEVGREFRSDPFVLG